MDSKSIVCKNCGFTVEASYCGNCGQKANTYRITWKELVHHLPHAILHLDEGFFYTLKQLTLRPGEALREYLAGKRKRYFNPFLMLLLTAGLCSYLYKHLDLKTILAATRMHELNDQNPTVASKYLAIRNVIFCVICSLGDKLFFFNREHTVPELIVTNTYAFAEISFLQLLFIPVLLLGRHFHVDNFFKELFVATALVYLFIVRYQFYQAKASIKMTIKIAVAVSVYFVIASLVAIKIVRPILALYFVAR